ncbi:MULTISPECIES: NUDIX domain-containing protein [Methylococcus]|jgi:ADP-ribose pyrophosphatase|uniref:ADP-ribose pyrophosphatase n=1 Tax=Methylococcus capsulatus TaxID=414 RepID=A0AA35V2W8_METCP|nr:NUDIX domain-containing protein [Methylococcus capsulatus]QXP90821.1 NUDIX domain-containing protein [Methylococcus capsulatus]QXP92435.1 NUDIX domain-containing protein [Methylococcus capsulatus]CAI8884824.1 ADP-ribose pyrophosphatase [Methylococcus capsulatus]
MTREFEVLREERLHGGFFTLLRLRLRHTLHGGGWSEIVTRELYHRSSCVAVIPYDPVADRVVLIEQFRVGPLKSGGNPWLLEIVAGAVEPGEHTDEVAHRETLEEAGAQIHELIPVSEFFTTPGGCSESITLYCGIVDSSGLGGIHGLAEEHEDILVSVVDFAAAMILLAEGRIRSAIPIIGLQWLALNRERLRMQYGVA